MIKQEKKKKKLKESSESFRVSEHTDIEESGARRGLDSSVPFPHTLLCASLSFA